MTLNWTERSLAGLHFYEAQTDYEHYIIEDLGKEANHEGRWLLTIEMNRQYSHQRFHSATNAKSEAEMTANYTANNRSKDDD